MSQKKQMLYRRRGWKDKPLFLGKSDSKAGTCSLEDESGNVRVTGLPLIEKPEEEDELPPSYATPAASGGRSIPIVDPDKVSAVLDKFHSEEAEVTESDLEKVNVPTLRGIAEGMELTIPQGAKSEDIKLAILDAAEPSGEDGGESGAGDETTTDDPVEKAVTGGAE